MKNIDKNINIKLGHIETFHGYAFSFMNGGVFPSPGMLFSCYFNSKIN